MGLLDDLLADIPEKSVDILATLETSKFKFFLGGSRRMNQKEPELIPIQTCTDWDFYCEYSDEVIGYLEGLGFKATGTDQKYWDDECLGIMKYGDILNEPAIQVVLRRDPMFYRMVFESITPEFYYDYLWKSGGSPLMHQERIQQIFNQLFRTAKWKTK